MAGLADALMVEGIDKQFPIAIEWGLVIAHQQMRLARLGLPPTAWLLALEHGLDQALPSQPCWLVAPELELIPAMIRFCFW